MAESLSENFRRVASRGWARYFIHAGAMLLLAWPIYIVASGVVPTGLRGFGIIAAQATGFYLIALVIAWIALRFNRIAGWVAWVLLIGLMSMGVQ